MSVHRTKRPIPLGKRVASYRSHTPTPWTVGIWMAIPLILVLQLGQVLLGADWLWALVIAGTPVLLWLIWRYRCLAVSIFIRTGSITVSVDAINTFCGTRSTKSIKRPFICPIDSREIETNPTAGCTGSYIGTAAR